MNWDTIGKYAAGLVLNSAVYYLVVVNKVDAQVFVALATGELSALGVYHAAMAEPPNGNQKAPP